MYGHITLLTLKIHKYYPKAKKIWIDLAWIFLDFTNKFAKILLALTIMNVGLEMRRFKVLLF